MTILSINDLHVSFNTDRGLQPVLCGVELMMYEGESLALVGESGSGKSVTAQAILQMLGRSGVRTKGEIFFDGAPLHSKSQKEMEAVRGKKIGMIHQDPMTSLNPTLSIGWQIAEMLIVHDRVSRSAARLGAIELLKRVGIADATSRYDAYPFQLSGGMRQRVLIAMALSCQPKLLIADEPTTALDVTIQAQILELLRQIQQETGMSLLLITQDLAIVASLCDRVAVMNNGRIVEINTVDNLFYSPQHPYTTALLEAKKGAINE
ncbi:MAG TPA: ABC transporter ATP-binding protein [Parachlamydiaceae bacterium]|nr:ABC transporter ATP-binding protein [Parachlamydiaceae bacterium]